MDVLFGMIVACEWGNGLSSVAAWMESLVPTRLGAESVNGGWELGF